MIWIALLQTSGSTSTAKAVWATSSPTEYWKWWTLVFYFIPVVEFLASAVRQDLFLLSSCGMTQDTKLLNHYIHTYYDICFLLNMDIRSRANVRSSSSLPVCAARFN